MDDQSRAIRRIVDVARRMLAGELSYLEGARVILESRSAAGIPERDPDVTAFVAIESDTDHLPIGAERENWSLEALTRLDPDVRQAEAWARRTAEEETRRLLQRFVSGPSVSTGEATPPSPARVAKLSALMENEWVPNVYGRFWWQEETTGPSRIVAAVSDDQIETALRLAAIASGPFLLLWVLHTPRAGSQRGRYQSPQLSSDDVHRVLRGYRDLFEQDGRSDIWIHAKAPELTVVVDQHDLIYAYGPGQRFISCLVGFQNARTAMPSPHAHNYYPQFDELEQMFASEFDWNISELRPEDNP